MNLSTLTYTKVTFELLPSLARRQQKGFPMIATLPQCRAHSPAKTWSLQGINVNFFACLGLSACFAILLMPGSAQAQYRTIDGFGNNQEPGNESWGQAGARLLRISPPDYPDDGSGETIVAWPTRENPRTISNTIASQPHLIFNDRGMTNMVWQWGQFLDHDVSFTEVSADNGTAPIPVLSPDDPLGPRPIPLDRSHFDSDTGLAGIAREQINEITAYIDASNVYGSDDDRAGRLRTFADGKLDSRVISEREFLPSGSPEPDVVFAGDVRAAEQIGLTSMHTLFLREHNRLAEALATENLSLSDEDIYQKARKIVGAQMQAITYNEFLPALLGSQAPDPTTFAYDKTVNAGIATEFSSALFRVGHTLLTSDLPLGKTGATVPLRDAFFDPLFIEDGNNMDLVLSGLSTSLSQEIDNTIVDDVRNFLFGPPGAGGLDLASLNIQRGRDHGLPDYNTVRQWYGLDPVTSFAQISSDVEVQLALESLYGDLNNIDLWVGALAEDHVPGSSVGELIGVGLVEQFTRLANGDRFFYLFDEAFETDADILAVTGGLDGLQSRRLSQIILDNTDLTRLPRNVFLIPEPTSFLLVVGLTLTLGRCRWRSSRSPSDVTGCGRGPSL